MPPGRIVDEPSFLPVQCVPLVQVTGVSYGFGPASTPGATPPSAPQLLAGIPAASQLESTATSAALAIGNGLGGMGRVGSCIRATASASSLCAGFETDGAARSAAVTSDRGTPTSGGVPWHAQQWADSTCATSQGRSLVGPPEPLDPVDPAEPLDPIDPAEPFDPVDPAELLEAADPVDPADALEPALPEPLEPLGPVEAVAPLDPVAADVAPAEEPEAPPHPLVVATFPVVESELFP